MFRASWRFVLLASVLMAYGAWPAAVSAQAEADHAAAAHDDSAHAESDGGGHAAGADEEHGGGHAEGPIQWNRDLALFSLIAFVCFLILLKKFAWAPLIDAMGTRESRFRNELAAAEEAHRNARELLRQHTEKLDKVADEVREIVASARSDADRIKQEIVTEARNEAETTKTRAVEEIEHARDRAVADLFQYMSNGIADATEHVLGRRLSGDDDQRLIDEALSQFSTRSE